MLEMFSDVEDIEEESLSISSVWDFGIDFETGLLNGKIVHGADALAVWCYFALKIQRYRFRAFSWEYGSETDDLIGENYGTDYTETEIKRMINECVCCHPNITGTENFNIIFKNSEMHISFKILTDFGDSDIFINLAGD